MSNALGGGENSSSSTETRQVQPGFTELLDSSGRFLSEQVRGLFNGEIGKPDWNSNDSPRSTVLTFVEGMEAILRRGSSDTARVEQALPDGFDVRSRETIALKQVFDRLGQLEKVDFPDRGNLEDSGLETFEVFPYAIDHEWLWAELDGAPQGRIAVSASGGDGWRFTPETLRNAPDLLDSIRDIAPVYGNARETELVERVFVPMLRNTPWWGWAVMILSVVPAFFVGRLTRWMVLRFGDEVEKRTKPLVGSMVRSVALAAAIIAGVLVFVLGGSFISFSPAVSGLYWDFVKGVLLVAVIFLLLGLTDIVATVIRKKMGSQNPEYGEMTVTIVQRVIRSFMVIILGIFLLENVLGFHVGALITGIGIIGLALSLAGKETAQNLFGAISIFVNRPFAVGDWIRFRGDIGEVVDVRMHATRIRVLDGEMKIVPNMQFISKEVDNLSMRTFIRREMNLSLPYGTPAEKMDKAMEILREIFGREEITSGGRFVSDHSKTEKSRPEIFFSDYGSYFLNLKIYYWYFIGETGLEEDRRSERGWFSYLDHCTLVNQAILRAFDEHEIEFAFPTQTIELERSAG